MFEEDPLGSLDAVHLADFAQQTVFRCDSLLGRAALQRTVVLEPASVVDGDPTTLDFENHSTARGIQENDVRLAIPASVDERHGWKD
jgi:hypothetical protein